MYGGLAGADLSYWPLLILQSPSSE